MQVFTPGFIRGLRSNLNFNIGIDPTDSESRSESANYDDHYFQIIIFENLEEAPKLVYGTKKDIEDTYSLEKKTDSPLDPNFPTLGALVDQGFLPPNGPLRNAERSTIRFLLQCRKLSQLMAHTWLDDAPENIKFAKKIFDSYNLIPETFWLEGSEEPKGSINNTQLTENLLGIKEENQGKDSFLIKPQYTSYSSISLALALCGQAYYYPGKSRQLTRICKPIFSTYEMIWEYALDLSWDTFYASRIDISAATGNPQPPYTRVTLGYPPQPYEFSSPEGQGKIEKWATLEDDDKEFGFYPDPSTDDWDNQQINCVEPPYPYLPLSCS